MSDRGQARDHEPGRQRQGPSRGRDDRCRRTRGFARTRGDDRRAHLGQHRRRPRHRCRAARLSVHLRDDRQGRAREDRVAAGVRRGGGRVPGRGRARRPAVVLLGGRTAGARDARRVPPEPVREPVEPVGARALDRPRDLAPDGRAYHPLRRGGRNRRHDHRRRPVLEVEEFRRADRRCRPGGVRLLGRIRTPVPRRRHRRGLLARHVRPDARRPGRRDQRSRTAS